MASKTCKCGKVLRPGERHSCPKQGGQQVSYNDNSIFFMLIANSENDCGNGHHTSGGHDSAGDSCGGGDGGGGE